jgi:uncharacterized protein (DUF1330 family)
VSALLIIQATVLDREPYRRYQQKVQPLIESQAIRSFWESPEYASIRALRDGAARVDVWAVPAQ